MGLGMIKFDGYYVVNHTIETLEIISTMIAAWKKQDRPLLETMKGYIS